MRKSGVRLIDLDQRCAIDRLTGNGFIITDNKPFIKDEKTMNGIHSPKYGPDSKDDDETEKMYSCECGSFVGSDNLGVFCPMCKSEVEFKELNIEMRGWLLIHKKYKILHPRCYKMLESLAGKMVLKDIIEFNKKPDKDGNYRTDEKKITKYSGIGLMGLYENFEEVVTFLMKRKPAKKKNGLFLLKNRTLAFYNSIPVFHNILRPVKKGQESYYAPADRMFRQLTNLVFNINRMADDRLDKSDIENGFLYAIQTTVDDIDQYCFNLYNKKKGMVRSEIQGGRCNYSARNVIIPDTGAMLKADEVLLPYISFLELYKPEIINILVKMKGYTPMEASVLWTKASVMYNEEIYKIMCYLVKNTKGRLSIALNRNPTINYGSFVMMFVKGVKSNFNDKTITLPVAILSAQNADFDGDQPNKGHLTQQCVIKNLSNCGDLGKLHFKSVVPVKQ